MATIKSVCVYCGSSSNVRQSHRDAARELGTGLASAGIRLVYGGGQIGLMGLIADAALAAGGAVTGIIPKFLDELEIGHTGCTELIVANNMHDRKYEMASIADAFVILPGGFGTLDELFETLTLIQTQKIRKKVPIVLYGKEFWDRVVDFQALAEFGVIGAADLKLFHRSDSVDDAFEYLTQELAEHHLMDASPSM